VIVILDFNLINGDIVVLNYLQDGSCFYVESRTSYPFDAFEEIGFLSKELGNSAQRYVT